MCCPTQSTYYCNFKRWILCIILPVAFLLLAVPPEYVRSQETDSFTAEADNLLESGHFSEALSKYQEKLPQAIVDKDYFHAKSGIGKCKKGLSEIETAKQTFKNLLYEYPDLDYNNEVISNYTSLVDMSGCQDIEPADAGENIVHGKYLFKEKNYPAARSKYQRYLNHFPGDKNAPYARYQVGRTYYREKDYENAVTEFRRVADEYPLSNKAGSAEWVIGYCRHYQGDSRAAILQFQKFIQDYPDHPMVPDARERLAALIHMVGLETGERSYWYQAMEVYNNLHDEQKNERPERAAFARMQEAALTLELALKGEEGITHEETVQKCRGVKEQYPEAPATVLATAKLMEGEAEFYQGYYEESLLAYEELFSEFTGNAECGTQLAAGHVMCGIALRALDRREEALEHFEEVITEYSAVENFAGCNFVNDALVWKAFLLSTRNYPNVLEGDLLEALLISQALVETEADGGITPAQVACAQETMERVQELAPDLYLSVMSESEGGEE